VNTKFCFKLGKTAAEIVELMRQVYRDNCLSRAQIFRWYARFKSGVGSIEDEARPGRPFSVHNEGLIAKARKRIQEERCVNVRMMADEFGVNRETIRQILVEDLGKRKVASRFVPHPLSGDQRHERVQYAYTGCPRRNVPDFGRVFLMLKYTDITQNTYVQSGTVTEIMAREKCGLLAGPYISIWFNTHLSTHINISINT